MKNTSGRRDDGMMYLRSRAFRPGVMNRHSCQKSTGDAARIPPKKAIFMRNVSRQRGRDQERAPLMGGVARRTVGLLEKVQNLVVKDEGHDAED